jgi:acyl dehydratase
LVFVTGLDHLIGHRFPGGTRRVEHWENWLLTDCTRRPPMADELLHPIVLFHVPIQAVGTSIGDIFRMCGGDGSPGSVTLLGYDWEYLAPMREGDELRAEGSFVDAATHPDDEGAPMYDDVTFSITLERMGDGQLVARVTNRWRFRRGSRPSHGGDPVGGSGVQLPVLTVEDVGADRMKTMAAILRDPYPIHWDREAVRAAGYGDRPVNQGPLNLGYIANMLMAWAGDGAIRRLTVGFHGRVFAGDTVIAGGSIESEHVVDGVRNAHCAVWLDRDGERLVSGTAEVAVA